MLAWAVWPDGSLLVSLVGWPVGLLGWLWGCLVLACLCVCSIGRVIRSVGWAVPVGVVRCGLVGRLFGWMYVCVLS